MCHVIAIRPVKDCFDSVRVREYEMDAPLDEALMGRLAEGGELTYYPQFPQPYFRILRSGALIIQGVVGKRTLRATFHRPECGTAVEQLRRQIEGVPAGAC